MDKRESPPETGGPGELKVRYSRAERYAMTRHSSPPNAEFTKKGRRIILFDLLFLFVIAAVILPLVMRFSEIHTFQGYTVVTKIRKRGEDFHLSLKISLSGEKLELPSGTLYEIEILDGNNKAAVTVSDLLPAEDDKRVSRWVIDAEKNPPPYRFKMVSEGKVLEFSLSAQKKRPRGALIKYLVDSW